MAEWLLWCIVIIVNGGLILPVNPLFHPGGQTLFTVTVNTVVTTLILSDCQYWVTSILHSDGQHFVNILLPSDGGHVPNHMTKFPTQ